MINQELIGKWSTPVENSIEKGAVRKFAQSIGDPNPLYVDEVYAKESRHGRLIAPPTFARTLDYGVVVGLVIPTEGLIHGEQQFHFERPLYVGETLWCSYRLGESYSRSGSLGKMTFLIFEEKGVTPQGETVFTSRSTVIMTQGSDT